MIISDKKEQVHYLDKICNEKSHYLLRINSNGMLEINHQFTADLCLGYLNGIWYGYRDMMAAASDGFLQGINTGKFLFAISEKRFLARREDGTTEFASSSKPLSSDALGFFTFAHDNKLCLYVIDGSKYKEPLAMATLKKEDNLEIFALSVIAMVRQVDPDAASKMEGFWSGKDTSSALLNVMILNYVGDENFDNTPPWS